MKTKHPTHEGRPASIDRQTRPPVVAVVGHIDHGKSTLLDYIRKSNIVDGEAGGITQHLSAYEVEHVATDTKQPSRITFLDTPGHAAFAAMRSRGLEVADVAVLVVSAEDGVKPQTLEALKLIQENTKPYIVALTKVDKPTANIERAKMSLVEHGVYLEGLGGDVPFVAISSKTGQGVPELLDLILLAAELEGLSADHSAPGEGLVIEAHVDPKRGNTATLIVQNGSVESGEYVVCGESFAPVRIMENYLGKNIKEALPGSPIRVVGFSSLPPVGAVWRVVEAKKQAEEDVADARATRLGAASKKQATGATAAESEEKQPVVLPLVIKTDFAGTGDAVVHEIDAMPKDNRLEVRVVSRGVGTISENDVKFVGGGAVGGIVVGFNVKVEKEARDLAERLGVTVMVFDIIYKLTEWLASEVVARRPRENSEEQTGSAKILKIFSATKGRVVVGGKVEEGLIADGAEVKLMRRDIELGRGGILSLQSQKAATKKVEAGAEFGAMLRTQVEPAAGDYLVAFEVVFK